ncbi:MAG: hypothetical protein AAGA70_02490 [Pseudomonadota bacterium]
MPKFLYIYHGGQSPETPEAQNAVMRAWMDWIGGLGTSFIDPGNPVGLSKTVSADGVGDGGGVNPASGYGMVEAASIDDAVRMARGCPILGDGGTVEVAEIHEM